MTGTLRTCAYCGGEAVRGPPSEDNFEEYERAPYTCMSCRRRLQEKETIKHPDELGTTVV